MTDTIEPCLYCKGTMVWEPWNEMQVSGWGLWWCGGLPVNQEGNNCLASTPFGSKEETRRLHNAAAERIEALVTFASQQHDKHFEKAPSLAHPAGSRPNQCSGCAALAPFTKPEPGGEER